MCEVQQLGRHSPKNVANGPEQTLGQAAANDGNEAHETGLEHFCARSTSYCSGIGLG